MKTSTAHPRRDTDPQSLLRDFARIYRAAQLDGGGVKAASLDQRVTGSKPGSSHLSFGSDRPLEIRMVESFARWLDVWEREAEQCPVSVVNDADHRSAAARERKRAILDEVGMDPTALAFVYGMTTESVRKLRGRNGRDPETGQRASQLRAERIDGAPTHRAPLTAPAGTTQRRLEERHVDGELGA
jgi:hypothetical protein